MLLRLAYRQLYSPALNLRVLYTEVVISQGRPFIMTFYVAIYQGYPSLSHFQVAQSQ